LESAFHVKPKSLSVLESFDQAQAHQVDVFVDLLLEKAIPSGIISGGDKNKLLERHVLDSLRAVCCLESSDRGIADIGSGAGLPGIPVAIAVPTSTIYLVEPKRRRAAFLELAVEKLGLGNVEVIPMRAASVALRVDACLARAFGPAGTAWREGRKLLSANGKLIFFAGRTWRGVEAQSAGQDASWEVCLPADFPWQGPLVIMRPSLTRDQE
jgi:16S rRNA (guanine527-N7)-methyltransferase